jgi:hypothetical protein
MWPFLSVWIKIFIWKFLDVRNVLWYELIKIIRSCHIYWLQYTIYFKFMEKLWQLSFLFLSYVNMDTIVYPRPDKLQTIISKFYKSSLLLTFIIVGIIIFEFVFFKGKIFYSLYILLILALVKPIIYFLSNFNGIGNNWIESCCLSDFEYLRGINLVIHFFFWFYFDEIRENFSKKIIITKKRRSVN